MKKNDRLYDWLKFESLMLNLTFWLFSILLVIVCARKDILLGYIVFFIVLCFLWSLQLQKIERKLGVNL